MTEKLKKMLERKGIDVDKPTEAEQRLDDIEAAIIELAEIIVGGDDNG